MKRVVMEFPDEDSARSFLAWFCDGGGEQQFLQSDEVHHDEGRKPIGQFDYSRCFPAWGYDPTKHGDQTVVAEHAADEA